MKTKIHTGIYQIRVRAKFNFEVLFSRNFFDCEKKEEFKKQITENLTGIEIFEDFIKCEDTIAYTE